MLTSRAERDDLEVCHSNRLAKQITLKVLTSAITQGITLSQGLYALSNDFEIKTMRHSQDGANYSQTARVFR